MGNHTFDNRLGTICGRAWLGLLAGSACVLDAEQVRAQTTQDKHHLLAQAGNQFEADIEENRFDGRAEFLYQDGVGGVNPSFFLHQAVADSDSGLLSISSIFSLAGGFGDPIFVDSSNRSVAVIEESIDPGFASSDTVVTVTARLAWGGSGSLDDGNGNPSSGSVSAGLRLNTCSAGFKTTFYSSVSGSGTGSASCPDTFYVTSDGEAGVHLLTVTQTMNGSALPNRFYVTAQIEGQADYLGYYDGGEYEASGTLSIEVSGVDYTYSSPTFLTVPEPGDAAHAIAVIAALGALARRSVAPRPLVAHRKR